MSFELSSLTDYVDEGNDLIKNSFVASKTVETGITIQSGCKGPTTINRISTDVLFQASGCDMTDNGTTEITQRVIDVNGIGSKELLCPDDLEAYFTQKELTPGSYYDSIGRVEPIYAIEKSEKIALQVESLFWTGDIGGGDLVDGIFTIAAGDADVVDGGTGALNAGNIVDAVDAMVAAAPENVLQAPNAVLYMNPVDYRTYLKALRDANLFHYNPQAGVDNLEYMIPTANVKAVSILGVPKDKMCLTNADNLYMGVDDLNDYSNFSIDWLNEAQKVRFLFKGKLGAQYAFSENVVIYQ